LPSTQLKCTSDLLHEAQKAIPVTDSASLYQFHHLPVAVGLIGSGYDVNATRAVALALLEQ
jgi:hypothetical protein